jgi:hypothetical protein
MGVGVGEQASRRPATATQPLLPGQLVRALAARGRLVVALLALIAALGLWRSSSGVARSQTLEGSLSLWLRHKGLLVKPEQIAWLAPNPNFMGLRPALFSARSDKDLHDVYFANVRVTGSAVVDVYGLTNTTRTSSADEDTLVSVGRYVAYAARVGHSYDAIVLLDTHGEPAAITHGWPWYAKLQNAVTNLQDSGRVAAFGTRRYNFVRAPRHVRFSVSGERIAIEADGHAIVLDPKRDRPLSGADALEFERVEKGRPGLITWVVDTVRRVPWIGRGPVEWLEHTVFGLTDRANRAYHDVVVVDTAAEVKQELQLPDLPAQPEPAPVVKRQLDIGWPPPPLRPVLEHSVKGEGAWLRITDDPFVAQNPDGSALFYRTFIRVDPERKYTRVYVTMWDPRQVQLGIVMGTQEPQSATGETGSGQIPRDPWVLSHLVGAFNGGFQSMHGEFGAMAEGRVYLPPKPYAATVAVFEDGRVGLGSWPGPGRRSWDEELANSQIPANMLGMRQNLTSVVEDDRYNPWQRWWWGAAPEWAKEQTYIPRSGLCLTNEGFLAYFWGESMGPEELGKAMLATRCERGMHLDMNGKHTGFEMYRPFPQGQSTPALQHALTASEYDGDSPDLLGIHVRARLAVSAMTPISFPRYLGRDPRDYFYLTRKPFLPGADLDVHGAAVAFSVEGVPDVGFPPAFARARLPNGAPAWVVRIDASRAVPQPLADPSLTKPVAYLTAPSVAQPQAAATAPAQVLYAHYQHGRLRVGVGPLPAGATALCSGPLLTEAVPALAAVGVDTEGFVVYAQAGTHAALLQALQQAGVAPAIALGAGRLSFEGEAGPVAVDGVTAQPVDESKALAFMAETRRAADVIFPNVKPRPYGYWGWLQDQRVRYFPSGPARFPMPDALKPDGGVAQPPAAPAP